MKPIKTLVCRAHGDSRCTVLTRVLLVSACFPLMTHAGTYEFTTLNPPDSAVLNGTRTIPFDINDSGQVVGLYNDAAGKPNGFVYGGGAFSVLDYPGSDPTYGTVAFGINAGGDVVGGWTDLTGGSYPGVDHGFLYSGGVYTSIDYPGTEGTRVDGINNVGQMVGFYNYTTAGFIDKAGSFTTLTFPDAFTIFPHKINDAGEIAGAYRDASRNLHGFLYNNGTVVKIDYPGAVDGTYGGTGVEDINDTGEVVGYYSDGSTYHGFLLKNGTFSTIDVPNSASTQIFGINNNGQLVGTYDGGGFIATPVPIPGSFLLPSGLAALAWMRRRRNPPLN